MKFLVSQPLAYLACLAFCLVAESRADNLLFTQWQPRLALLEMVPMGRLSQGVVPVPGFQASLHTPYAMVHNQLWQAFADMGYTYWLAGEGQKTNAFDVHIIRLMVGLAMPIPPTPWLLMRAGLGYHYLRGKRKHAGETYAFIEDGESEVAWHLGLSLEPPFPWLRHAFISGGWDVVPTLPAWSWIGNVSIGYRL
jgi:hypothetical protein